MKDYEVDDRTCPKCGRFFATFQARRRHEVSHDPRPKPAKFKGVPFKGYPSATYCSLCGLSNVHGFGCDGKAARRVA